METLVPDLENERRHNFTWTIKNFRSCVEKNNYFLKSPVFIAECLDQTKWYLILHPRGVKENEDYIACFLYLDEKNIKFECNFNLSLIGAGGRVIKSTGTGNSTFANKVGFGLVNFLSRKKLANKSTFSSKDTLTIKCSITQILPQNVSISESIGLTNIEVDQCSFSWKTGDLNSSEFYEVVKCPPLLVSLFDITIRVFEDDIRIEIIKFENYPTLSMICRIALLDVDGEEQVSREADNLFVASDRPSEMWKFPKFLKKSKLNSEKDRFLENGSFTLNFDISISTGLTSNSVEEKTVYESPIDEDCESTMIASHSLQDDLEHLFINKIQADFELRADKKVFPVHKCILSARSPVFLKMFESDIILYKTGFVEITDLESGTLELLLEFIYTGAIKNMSYQTAMKLFVAADKYQVFQLKSECSDFLVSVLSDRNVCHILIFSDLIKHEQLKDSAISYIKQIPETFFLSQEWEFCLNKNPQLATETLLKVSTAIGTNLKKESDELKALF